MRDERSFFVHPGAYQTFDNPVSLVASDITHYHHTQVQVGIDAHRAFRPGPVANVIVEIAEVIFPGPPAQAEAKGGTVCRHLHCLHGGDGFRLQDLIITVTSAAQVHFHEMCHIAGRATQPAPGR